MITVTDIKKSYKSGSTTYPALNGIDLEVEDGEYIAIVGTSGSGKSTLLNILGGMDRPTEGAYFWNEQNVSAMKMQELHAFRRDTVSFIFQRFALLSQDTVYENVEIPLLAHNVPKKERNARIEHALEQVELTELYKKRPRELSGGEQQRCAIARALVSENPLILADEPTGSLDKATGKKIMDLLEMFVKQGKTLLVVTHDLEVASRAKRMIRIEDGKIIEDTKK